MSEVQASARSASEPPPEAQQVNQQDPHEGSLEILLGAHPQVEKREGPEIDANLAVRWESYLTSGLDKDCRKQLAEKWTAPSNCKMLNAPALNPEVRALLSSTDLKKDRFQENLQELIGKGIAAEGMALTQILTQRDKVDAAVTEALVDSGKLLTDMFHTISTHRKFEIKKYFNEKVQRIASQQKTDALLLGSDFAEKCKAAKQAETTASDLLKPSTSKANRNLNSQRPPFKTKLKIENRRGGDRYMPFNRVSKKTGHENRKSYQKYRNKN